MLSPLDGIEGIAPLFFSFTPAHAMLTHWKDHGGTHLEEKLFLMSEGLKQELKAVEFDFILSVPQRLDRNWERGHSSSLKTAHFFSRMVGRPVRHTLELNSKVSSVKQASQDQWGRHFSENPFQFAEPYS
jgi:predicted amidophosphoribosyltransferase